MKKGKKVKTPLGMYNDFCDDLDQRFSILSEEALGEIKYMIQVSVEDAFKRGRVFGRAEKKASKE